MELRYRARAEDRVGVCDLAHAERFRAQFIEGRDPGAIRDDISLAFRVASELRRIDMVVDLILCRHELAMRTEALNEDLFDALIALGEWRAAQGLLNAEGVELVPSKGYQLVDVLLEAGELTEARAMFEAIEPIAILLGAEGIEPRASEEDLLVEWADRALVFRDPGQILAALSRIRPRDERSFGDRFNMDDYRKHLKVVAARGQLRRHPNLAADTVLASLELDPRHLSVLVYEAAQAAFDMEEGALAVERLLALRSNVSDGAPWIRREAAGIAVSLGRVEDALAFLAGVSPPSLAGRDFGFRGDDLGAAVRQIVLHASLLAQTGQSPLAGVKAVSRLLSTFQTRLETVGRIIGENRSGRRPSVDALRELRELLTFLDRAEGERTHDSDRWAIDSVTDQVVSIVLSAAQELGGVSFSAIAEEMDLKLASGAGRLGRSAVRRAYAVEAFRVDRDAARAERRIAYEAGKESSPREELAEAARTVQAYVAVDLKEKARSIMVSMHSDGLGYARPAKKDPQYATWRDLFVRACAEDPAGRRGRLQFLARFLSGMTKTEGDGAARRLVGAFVSEAAQAGPEWARQAMDDVDVLGLASWSGLVQAAIDGVLKRRPDLASLSVVILGRLVLPFASEDDYNPFVEVIRVAPKEQLEGVVSRAVEYLETDCHQAKRILFIEEALDAAVARGCGLGTEALKRWRAERRDGRGPREARRRLDLSRTPTPERARWRTS